MTGWLNRGLAWPRQQIGFIESQERPQVRCGDWVGAKKSKQTLTGALHKTIIVRSDAGGNRPFHV